MSIQVQSWRNDDYEIMIYPCIVRLIGFGLYVTRSGDDLSEDEFLSPQVQKCIIEHFSKRIYDELSRAVKDQNPVTKMNGVYMVKVVLPEITFATIDRFGGTGTSCSLDAFLGGQFQDYIIQHFGATILAEIAQSTRDMLTKYGAKLPQKTVAITNAESLVDLAGKEPSRVESWEWGMNFEYNYSARIYDSCILWKLEMDEQWGGTVYQIVQSFDSFIAGGAPDEQSFKLNLPDDIEQRIHHWIELEKKTHP